MWVYRVGVVPTMWLVTRLGSLSSRKWRRRLVELQRPIHVPTAGTRPRLWVHAASMGEFEQVRTVVEQLAPEWSVIATFTSISGLDHGRRLSHILDGVFILPSDALSSMRRLVDAIQPDAVLLSRYDLWPMMLQALEERDVPSLLVNATIPSRSNGFLRSFYTSLYAKVTTVYAVDALNANALSSMLQRTVAILPDTRYDRVLHAAASRTQFTSGSSLTLVFGSVWEADIALIHEAYNQGLPEDVRIIIVPHEPTDYRVTQIMSQLPVKRVSTVEEISASTDHVVVDSVGVLITIYGLAHAAYVGGGLGFNVHSVAEPAAFELAIACGPKFDRSTDAKALAAQGGLTSVSNAGELRAWIHGIVLNEQLRRHTGALNQQWIVDHCGSSNMVVQELQRMVKLPSNH
jgi:3-deoxy-D-manno-octulosonic-acid transferase